MVLLFKGSVKQSILWMHRYDHSSWSWGACTPNRHANTCWNKRWSFWWISVEYGSYLLYQMPWLTIKILSKMTLINFKVAYLVSIHTEQSLSWRHSWITNVWDVRDWRLNLTSTVARCIISPQKWMICKESGYVMYNLMITLWLMVL